MPVNEKTSPKVAKIASKVLSRIAKNSTLTGKPARSKDAVSVDGLPVCYVAELKALAASALTQTADRKKK